MKSYHPENFREQPPGPTVRQDRRADDQTIAQVKQLLLDQQTTIQMQFENHESNMDTLRKDVREQVKDLREDLRHHGEQTILAMEKIFTARALEQDLKIEAKLGCIDDIRGTLDEHHEDIKTIKTSVKDMQEAAIKADAAAWSAAKKQIITGIIAAIISAILAIGTFLLAMPQKFWEAIKQ